MPKELPKHFDSNEVEGRTYSYWEEGNFFHSDVNPDKEPYTIMIPPPNVTSALHLGHAFDNTCQDIFIRYHRARGYETLWMPGTDHAGIATQNAVERQLREEGKTRHDLGRDAFVARAWEWREQYGNHILHQLRRLGSSCDWRRTAFTMDEQRSRAVTEVFCRLYEKGLIYRGKYIVNWCPRCTTALSDEEAVPQEQSGKLWHIKYPIKGSDEFVVVATTRPETMLGDTGIAVNPKDDRYRKLIGKTIVLPLMDREIPVIEDDFVDPEFGSGVVKVTPAHDPNDFEMGNRHDLPRINVLNENGTINEEGGAYAGLDRFEAREQVLADLEKLGLILEIEEHMHAVPHCDRCKSVVEPYLSEQWFVKMKPLAEPALQAALDGEVRFHPERFKTTYVRWMEGIRDWCISRQLWWGHRIPVYYCDAGGHEIVSREKPAACPHCQNADLRQDEDVLDTWFSSWLWPFSTLGWPDQTPELAYYYPTDTLVTGPDIIFFWVARMIMAGIEFMGDVPFRDVYFHGIIRDAQGRKLSKSLGNGIDPLVLIEDYGADAVRFSIIQLSAEGQDISLAPEMIETGRNFCNKLWNAFRLVEMQLPEDFERVSTPWNELPQTHRADRWIVSRLASASRSVAHDIEAFHLHEALDTLYHFFWDDFCSWYLETAKVRWYGEDPDAQREAQTVAYNVLRGIIVMLHPFVPFIAEEIWQILGDNVTSPAIAAEWPDVPDEFIDAQLEREEAVVHEVMSVIRNARQQYGVKPGDKIAAILRVEDDTLAAMLRNEAPAFDRLANVSELTVAADPEIPKPAATGFVSDVGVFVPLADLIDLDTERARLERELQKTQGHLTGTRKKLENPKFVDKAPAEVVAQARERLQELEELVKKLEASLAELG